jgi:hypothetical protein
MSTAVRQDPLMPRGANYVRARSRAESESAPRYFVSFVELNLWHRMTGHQMIAPGRIARIENIPYKDRDQDVKDLDSTEPGYQPEREYVNYAGPISRLIQQDYAGLGVVFFDELEGEEDIDYVRSIQNELLPAPEELVGNFDLLLEHLERKVGEQTKGSIEFAVATGFLTSARQAKVWLSGELDSLEGEHVRRGLPGGLGRGAPDAREEGWYEALNRVRPDVVAKRLSEDRTQQIVVNVPEQPAAPAFDVAAIVPIIAQVTATAVAEALKAYGIVPPAAVVDEPKKKKE